MSVGSDEPTSHGKKVPNAFDVEDEFDSEEDHERCIVTIARCSKGRPGCMRI